MLVAAAVAVLCLPHPELVFQVATLRDWSNLRVHQICLDRYGADEYGNRNGAHLLPGCSDCATAHRLSVVETLNLHNVLAVNMYFATGTKFSRQFLPPLFACITHPQFYGAILDILKRLKILGLLVQEL